MFPILILREEIVCLAILLLILFTARTYKSSIDLRSFLRMGTFATGHLILDILTVITVNNTAFVPGWINKLLHMIFYLFSVLFAYELCRHTAAICCRTDTERRIRRYGRIPIILLAIALPFIPIEYVQGRGTAYSAGTAVSLTYGIALLYLLISVLMILFSRKNNRKAPLNPLRQLLPIVIVLIACEFLQILIPELLFTGGLGTVIMVTFFCVSLENPVETLNKRLQQDALTGLASRHSYNDAVAALDQAYAANPDLPFSVVFCDINNLKFVNDTIGHNEGDNYIRTVSLLLSESLKTARQIFRVGGDEFVAIYDSTDSAQIDHELQHLRAQCKERSLNSAYPISVAVGYAASNEDYRRVQDVIEIADHRMCLNKAEQKVEKFREESSIHGELNVSGLTGRTFDAFSSHTDRSYLFLHNRETGVTRLSKAMVQHFGLPGEYIADFDSVWINCIHPQDRERYLKNISLVHAGKIKVYKSEYRARNVKGEYVTCTCNAAVLSGKDGEPDLFAGTIVNHSLLDKIDPLTGLPNNAAFSHRLSQLIENHTTAAIMKLSLTSFSRINLLYGYSRGNEVILRFAEAVQNIVGNRGEIYRLDGVKFALVFPHGTKEEINKIYQNIQFAAQHKINAGYSHMPLRVAGGVYMKPAEYLGKPSTIRSNMMFAYEHSKYDNYGSLEFYQEPLGGGGSEYKLLSAIHQDAVSDRSGFYLRYQPIVDSDTERVTGVETLLRWHNVEYGEVGPLRFIQWLETDPCFFDLGCWILKQAITDAKEMTQYNPDFTLNVNITVQQLQHERFRSSVQHILEETGFPPQRLCLELTERCRSLDEDFLRQEINHFHTIGVKIAMDDVGTGSSAFALILRLPVDEVKLDQTFVRQIQNNPANQAFVQSVIDISKEKGYSICFEGVEDHETCHYLKRYQNTLFQGYYFARPLVLADLRLLMKKQAKLHDANNSAGNPPPRLPKAW